MDVSLEQTPVEIKKKTFWTRRKIILVVVLTGLLLRIWAAWQLPVDFDEPIYLENGYQYAQLIQAGDVNGLINYSGTSEHPPLVKIVYSLTILLLGKGVIWEQALFISRMVSVIFGTLAVLVVALMDPLAGGFLAIQTLAVKYTSQAYLEALPLFAGLMAIYLLKFTSPTKRWWFFISAIALGITGAGKYSYFPIFFVILYLLIWEKRERLLNILLYFAITAITFFIFDPYIWSDTFQCLVSSLSFHAQYSQGAHVQEVGYPWYQPIFWVSRSFAFVWHPEVFFYMGMDGIIFLLALPGIWLDWKPRRWVVIWIITSMLALLLWPTKWPQYTLVVIPAFCLAASTAVKVAYEKLREQEMYWEWFHNMFPRPAKRYIIFGGIVLGLLIFGVLATEVLRAVNSIGWAELTTSRSGLPSNSINMLQALPDGRMLIGTEGGGALWKAASGRDVQDDWQVFTPANSLLPDQQVLSVAQDKNGIIWFGTDAGLASYDGQDWQVYRSSDFGLNSEQVNSIAVDESNNIWIGTKGGVARFDGTTWTAFTEENSELIDNAVFSIAYQALPKTEKLWFGTLSGVSSFDIQSGLWENSTRENIDLGVGGVSYMMFDSSGRLWVCTGGGGISILDGDQWTHFKVSNSRLPYSIIESVAELEPGEFWIAASLPNTAGGVLAKYDGTDWKIFRERFSGYPGAETVTIAKDEQGRYWFGTRTDGIIVYDPKK
jgi:hypothetical protein